MLRLALSGCGGKMCRTIESLLQGDKDITITAGFDVAPQENRGFPIYPTAAGSGAAADVVIDFSNPSSLEGLFAYAQESGAALVLCTTGYSASQRAAIDKAAQSLPLFFSANMSLGVNLMIRLSRIAATALYPDFDIELIERHHNQKIDAPSGTALAIADAVNDALGGGLAYQYDRHSIRKKRDKPEIGIHAVRGGTEVGTHELFFAGGQETLAITHTATSRDVFARGAIAAARFMPGKGPGLYTMDELLSELSGSKL